MARGKGNRMARVKKIIRRCHGMASVRKAMAHARFCIWRYSSFDMDSSPDLPTDVPKGHIPVYVGSERSRFIIPTIYLNHYLFKALLKKAEEEFGFHYQMGLTIPCEERVFEYLMLLLGRNDEALKRFRLDELIAGFYCMKMYD
eukprot:Gb_15664 [translate_table: standard]